MKVNCCKKKQVCERKILFGQPDIKAGWGTLSRKQLIRTFHPYKRIQNIYLIKIYKNYFEDMQENNQFIILAMFWSALICTFRKFWY